MQRILTITICLSLLSASGLPSAAQSTPVAPGQACEADSRYAEFDFWLGTWDVFVNGQKVGENTISKEENGCLVLEKWTDVRGGTGQSYNYFEPDTERWRQVWVSRVMSIDYVGGLTEEGSMELRGHVIYFHNAKKLEFFGRWTPQEDGTVLQYFEQYDEAKQEMVPLFTGTYRRKS